MKNMMNYFCPESFTAPLSTDLYVYKRPVENFFTIKLLNDLFSIEIK